MNHTNTIDYIIIGDVYISKHSYHYFSPRYGKNLIIPANYPSNGANWVPNLSAAAFFVHDYGSIVGRWNDGTAMCNRELSTVYADILKADGFWLRSKIRWLGTFLFGGGEARKNGLWRLKNG
jgi:hypothetical protein